MPPPPLPASHSGTKQQEGGKDSAGQWEHWDLLLVPPQTRYHFGQVTGPLWTSMLPPLI